MSLYACINAGRDWGDGALNGMGFSRQEVSVVIGSDGKVNTESELGYEGATLSSSTSCSDSDSDDEQELAMAAGVRGKVLNMSVRYLSFRSGGVPTVGGGCSDMILGLLERKCLF